MATGPGPAPPPPRPPPHAQAAGSPSPSAVSAQGRAPGGEPLITLRGRCSQCGWGGGEKAAGSPAGGTGGCWRRSSRSPEPFTRRLRTMGPHEDAAGDSGWKIKPEKIQGEACGEDSDHAASWRACGAGVGAEELDSASRSWRLGLRARGPLGPPRDKTRSGVTRPLQAWCPHLNPPDSH